MVYDIKWSWIPAYAQCTKQSASKNPFLWESLVTVNVHDSMFGNSYPNIRECRNSVGMDTYSRWHEMYESYPVSIGIPLIHECGDSVGMAIKPVTCVVRHQSCSSDPPYQTHQPTLIISIPYINRPMICTHQSARQVEKTVDDDEKYQRSERLGRITTANSNRPQSVETYLSNPNNDNMI